MDAIYARQSIDKKDSVSIESQIELCRKQAAGEAKVYEDRGYSGKNTNRPAFEQLINDICSGGIDKILVYTKALARKLGYSERWIRKIVEEVTEKELSTNTNWEEIK